MQAIILAAGRGSRLAQYNPDGRPKCLLEFDGRSLLQRHLHLLHHFGVKTLHLVTGYESEQIIDHIAILDSRPELVFHYNPRYLEGSVISLATADEALKRGEDVILMDADVLYHPQILYTLMSSRHKDCFLVDQGFAPGDEPVKVCIQDDTIIEFRKQLAEDLVYDTIGESVGFFRFSPETSKDVADLCQAYDRQGRGEQPHEEVLRDLVRKHPGRFGWEDVTGLPWLEIDFPEDVERARDTILPAIQNEYPNY